MRGRGGMVIALVAVLFTVAGCGDDSEGFSDSRISDAIGVKGSQIGGDPFCEVDEVLNDAAEIEKASERKDAAIITSKAGNTGVTVVPPFPDDCEAKVQKGLDELDPKPKEKE